MSFFNKQKEEFEEEENRTIKRTKRPELNALKKRKKEPPKPWGKKERVIVLIVLLLTVITSLLLLLSSVEWKLPGFPRIKLPSLSLFKEKTIVFESEDRIKIPEEIIKKSKKAADDFNNATSDLSGVYGLYIIDLKSGFGYGVSEKEIFQAASLIKLPVMTAMFKEAEEGNLKLDTVYTLQGSDKIQGAGSLYYEPAGTKVTYEELLELMGNQSDNTAFGIVRRIIGDEKINRIINDVGMKTTNLEENETSPYDIGIFFEKLWKGELLSAKNSQKLLGYLTNTSYEAWIAAGIPEGVRVSHKYGREVHVVNDAGIVFADRPFVIAILSKGIVDREADEIFPVLANTVYSDLSSF